MSTLDAEALAGSATADPLHPPALTEAHLRDVGGLQVRRLLPIRGRRTVGGWCFIDHYGPVSLDGARGMLVPAHPHIGLQTVTWLVEGEVLHLDSLGSEQLIAPGQLNLMTAANGIAHYEESRGEVRTLHGLQLWIALPDSARQGAPAFEHHGSLPEVSLGPFVAKVLVGTFGAGTSPATTYSELVGVEIRAPRAGTTELDLPESHEYVATVTNGSAAINDTTIEPGKLLHLAQTSNVRQLAMAQGSRLFLFGGVPLGEPILMWWNFVARTAEEIADAVSDWSAGRRFGSVDRHDPMSAPAFDITRLRPHA